MTKRFKQQASALIAALILAFGLAIFSLVLVRPAWAQQPPGQDVLVEDVEVRGNRRIPKESILYYVQSKPGDRYSQALAQRDLEAIIGLGFFDPLQTKLLLDDGPRGGKIIIFQVREYPIIRDLQYRGLKSATARRLPKRINSTRPKSMPRASPCANCWPRRVIRRPKSRLRSRTFRRPPLR
jgi:outer membrane protein insertion porin family